MPRMSPRPKLRARVAAAVRKLGGDDGHGTPDPGPGHSGLERWLVPLFSAQLDPVENRIKGAGPEGYRLFRELDDDLWALLLTREYEAYPAIRSFLPDLPPPELQQKWNGDSGPVLAAQSVGFYRKLRQVHRLYGSDELAVTPVLDFGCGWGRLTRMLARDVESGNLYGCDPVEEVLDVCRETRVPAELFRSDFLPESLEVDRRFGLIFAFSVFTHISERAARASFSAIREALRPGGLFTFTIRPAAYLDMNPMMAPLLAELGDRREETLAGPAYLFLAHGEKDHPQYDGTEMTYGESVITLPWIAQNWTDGFEIVDVSVMLGDIYQVAVTLKKA